jgi:hypothetical protein
LFPLQSLVCGGIALASGAQPNSVAALLGDMKWLALQGCCVVPLSFIALTVGPKYISTAKVSLFVLLETVLKPQEAAASCSASALIHVSFFCLDFV